MPKKSQPARGDIRLYKELMRLWLAVLAVIIICAGLGFFMWRVMTGGNETRAIMVFVPFLIAALILALMSSFLSVAHVKALSNAGLLPGGNLWQRNG